MYETLEGEHIRLRKARETDWRSMFINVWGNEAVYNRMLFQPTLTEEEAVDRCRRSMNYQQENYAWFVALKDTDEAIGLCAIGEDGPGHWEERGIGIGTAFPLALRLEGAVQRQGLAPGRHAQVASLLHRAAGGCVKGVHAGGLSRFAAGNVAVPVDEHFHLDLEVAVQARRRTPVPPKLLECAGNIAVVGCAACDDPCGQHGRRRDREQDGKQKRRKRTKMKTCGHGIPRWNRKPGLSVAGQARASGDRGAGSPRTLET